MESEAMLNNPLLARVQVFVAVLVYHLVNKHFFQETLVLDIHGNPYLGLFAWKVCAVWLFTSQ